MPISFPQQDVSDEEKAERRIGERRRRFASSATGEMEGERSPPRHRTKGVRGRASLEHKGGGRERGRSPAAGSAAGTLDVRAASLAEEAAAARIPGKHGRVRKTGVHSSVLWDQGVGNSLNTEHRERVGHTGVGRRGHRVRSVERRRN